MIISFKTICLKCEAYNCVPRCVTCFSTTIRICVILEFKSYIIFKSWSTSIISCKIIQSSFVFKSYSHIRVIIVVIGILVIEFSINNCFDVFDLDHKCVFLIKLSFICISKSISFSLFIYIVF